ncbi:MAG: hypothetical protein IT376_21360 [Polyangiaceae bacterium]|nr:hypothetical protein [Polyangiaceae bacterium]
MTRAASLWLPALVVALGCGERPGDPPPPATSARVAPAPPGAVGARAASASAALLEGPPEPESDGDEAPGTPSPIEPAPGSPPGAGGIEL